MELEGYVRSHPRGVHVQEALVRIAKLSQQARDEVAWEANTQRVAAERATEERQRQERELEEKRVAEELKQQADAERAPTEEKREEKEQEAAAAKEVIEKLDWAGAQSSEKALNTFIEKWPDSIHLAEARVQLARLNCGAWKG